MSASRVTPSRRKTVLIKGATFPQAWPQATLTSSRNTNLTLPAVHYEGTWDDLHAMLVKALSTLERLPFYDSVHP